MKAKVAPYQETHIKAFISLEHSFDFPLDGDIGIQIAEDGRIWVCINGLAFIRATPHLDRKMGKE